MEELATGFRFFPTEEELISFYLHHKLKLEDDETSNIHRVIPILDIYRLDPWQLPCTFNSMTSSQHFVIFFKKIVLLLILQHIAGSYAMVTWSSGSSSCHDRRGRCVGASQPHHRLRLLESDRVAELCVLVGEQGDRREEEHGVLQGEGAHRKKD